MYPTLQHYVNESIKHAMRHAENCNLSGEGLSSDGYDSLEGIFERALERVRLLREHAHEWDRETGYCVHCGADGNA